LAGLVENPPRPQLSTVLAEEESAREFRAFATMLNLLLYSACIGFAPAPRRTAARRNTTSALLLVVQAFTAV